MTETDSDDARRRAGARTGEPDRGAEPRHPAPEHGGMTGTELRLEGDLGAAGFPDWICHRARLLDLSGWVATGADGAVSIVVAGPQALIDAMEMACSLGPREVLVDRIERRPHGIEAPLNGFHKR